MFFDISRLKQRKTGKLFSAFFLFIFANKTVKKKKWFFFLHCSCLIVSLQQIYMRMDMDKKRILLAEDEQNISNFVSRGLQDFGYAVTAVADGSAAWKELETDNPFDLLLLDVRMPQMSGLEVCERFRKKYGYQTPVIMLTALRTTDDIVMGLQAGADDYIAKPFKFMELVARIEAHIRRKAENDAETDVTCGDLRLDAAAHKARRGDVETILSIKEYRLLEYFVRHQGEVLTRRQLLKDVWDKDFDTNTNVVDVYVRYLRSKIDAPFENKLIKTVIGKGYIMSDKDSR